MFRLGGTSGLAPDDNAMKSVPGAVATGYLPLPLGEGWDEGLLGVDLIDVLVFECHSPFAEHKKGK